MDKCWIREYRGKEKDVVIPDKIDGRTVVGILEYAFSSCSNIISIVLPNSVTSIGYSAFCGCSSLKSIVISNGLTSITIPSSVTSIGESAFACDEPVESVIIKGKKGSYVEQWANKNGYRFMEQ